MIFIGDKVRVKTWEQMEEEFGLSDLGSIDCEGYFTEDMKHLCGKEFTIVDIIVYSDFKYLYTETKFDIDRLVGLKEADDDDFVVTPDMVEEI